jgi:hypothetical protein
VPVGFAANVNATVRSILKSGKARVKEVRTASKGSISTTFFKVATMVIGSTRAILRGVFHGIGHGRTQQCSSAAGGQATHDAQTLQVEVSDENIVFGLDATPSGVDFASTCVAGEKYSINDSGSGHYLMDRSILSASELIVAKALPPSICTRTANGATEVKQSLEKCVPVLHETCE